MKLYKEDIDKIVNQVESKMLQRERIANVYSIFDKQTEKIIQAAIKMRVNESAIKSVLYDMLHDSFEEEFKQVKDEFSKKIKGSVQRMITKTIKGCIMRYAKEEMNKVDTTI